MVAGVGAEGVIRLRVERARLAEREVLHRVPPVGSNGLCDREQDGGQMFQGGAFGDDLVKRA